MKIHKSMTALKALAFCAALGLIACAIPAGAQPYETSLTTGTLTENFDELGISATASAPPGWVFAQGVGLPVYSAPLNCQLPAIQFLTNTPPYNCQSCARAYDGGATGGTGNTATPTGGARVNYSDSVTATDRAIGFMSLNSTGSTDYRSPTNYIMFGFTNNTGSNIVSLAVTNNIKMFRESSSSAFQTAVAFYYSYDGSNWTHASGGDVGPFPSGTTAYFFSSPVVSNVFFTLNSLSIPNNTPFYLAWRFVIANSSGSFSAGLALDDVGLTASFGNAAGTSVWTAGSGGWNTPGNWLGSSLPVSGNNLVFAAAGGLSTNDLAAVSTGTGNIGSLTFSNIAGSYTLSGNAVSLGLGLTNNTASGQTINLPLTLLSDETFSAASGAITYANTITNGGFGVTFAGAGNSTLNGLVTGGGSMNMSGGGVLLLNGANTYSGATTISSGTVRLGTGERIPDVSSVSVNGATLDLNGFSETIGNLSGGGNVTMGNGSLTVGSNNLAGTFTGVISGNGGLTKIGSGIETIGATNSYHGTTLLTFGTLAIANVATLGDGPLVLAGGTFQLTGTRDTTNGILTNAFVLSGSTTIQNTTSATAGTRNLPFGGAVIATNGTLTIQNITTGNFTNIMNLRFHGLVTNFTQPIVFDNSLAASATNNTCEISSWNTNGTQAQLFSGAISGPGEFLRNTQAVGTGGSSILTGNNTFTEGTVVSGGYVGVGADSVSSGGAVISGPLGTGTLTFDDDTTPAGLAGVGIFSYGGAHVVDNRVVLNGVTNTAIVGSNPLTFTGVFDVGGVAKTLTISNTALTTISGVLSNTAGLTLAGSGALALTADNTATWPGTMTINGAKLLANNSSGSATGTNIVTVSSGMLAGTGTVAGAVAATTGGSVSPGNNVGILTLQNGLNLSGGGALVWDLGANSTASPGVNFSQLALTGGALNMTGSAVLSLQFTGSATAPNTNNVFWQSAHSWRIVTLSGGASITGTAFSSIVNGSSGAGNFSTSNDASGVLLTFTPGSGTPSSPKIVSASVAGNQITFSGTNGVANGTYYVVSSTNAAQLLSTWPVISTNSFGPNGGFTNTITITPSEPGRYYRLKLP